MLEEYLLKYIKKFDDGFPMIPLGWGKSEREIIDMIIKCLDSGKDAYAMGWIVLDNDIKY